jgi:hypothetical protein
MANRGFVYSGVHGSIRRHLADTFFFPTRWDVWSKLGAVVIWGGRRADRLAARRAGPQRLTDAATAASQQKHAAPDAGMALPLRTVVGLGVGRIARASIRAGAPGGGACSAPHHTSRTCMHPGADVDGHDPGASPTTTTGIATALALGVNSIDVRSTVRSAHTVMPGDRAHSAGRTRRSPPTA